MQGGRRCRRRRGRGKVGGLQRGEVFREHKCKVQAAAAAASRWAALLPLRGARRPVTVTVTVTVTVLCRGAAPLAGVPKVGTAAGVHGVGVRGGFCRQLRGGICLNPVDLARSFLRGVKSCP